MAMTAGRFNNVFKRLDVELDRMLRIGVPKEVLDNIRSLLLKYKPADEPPLPARPKATTPYQIAFNRLEAYKRGEFTWEYFLSAWDKCPPDDQQALNEILNQE